MHAARYKGFTITARTYQVRGTGRWTLDLLIGQREMLRAFSGESTYCTKLAAEAGCLAFAQDVIDGSRPGCSLAELEEHGALGRVLYFPRPGSQHHRH